MHMRRLGTLTCSTFGDGFTALYLAEVGQVFLQDGA
jgi:hypothetical protein